MPRSSESVAALASALAKAQAELTNPEKSLIATLPAERGGRERTFRYAPLSGGLEIVRKTLGRHEIATIQSTAIDRDSGTIKLTTTLAHASGEWIASDWPVCSLADLPTPHRMGAALTYARRYGLFTLVGIAGEDDLDAPDLPLQTEPVAQPEPPAPPLAPALRRSHGKSYPPKPVVILDFAASLQQRDELLGGLVSIASFDAAAEWAKSIIPVKNTLTAEHARDVEAALEVKLGEIGDPFEEPLQISETPNATPSQGGQHPENGDVTTLATVDRSTLTIGHTPRRRNKAHLKFVATQPCLLCGRQPSDPHHLKFAQVQALGRKVSDEFTVPLCRTHHRELHNAGSEVDWWEAWDRNVDPLEIAKGLWEQSLNRASQPLPVLSASQVLIRD